MGGLVDALGFAIDESNHGRDQEVFVAVCSDLEEDLIFYQEHLKRRVGGRKGSKKNIPEDDFLKELLSRDFRYLCVDRSDYDLAKKGMLVVEIAKQLISPFWREAQEHPVEVYVDGKLVEEQIRRMSQGVAGALGVPQARVGVHQMPKTKDKTTRKYKSVQLLGLADTAANYIFRKNYQKRELPSAVREKEIKFHAA